MKLAIIRVLSSNYWWEELIAIHSNDTDKCLLIVMIIVMNYVCDNFM